jgi:hypothetical protein
LWLCQLVITLQSCLQNKIRDEKCKPVTFQEYNLRKKGSKRGSLAVPMG